jgi:hypothetical protein
VSTVLPEHVTRLDDLGEGRHHDVVALGVAGGKLVLVAIEAKNDESLGPLIGEYLAEVERADAQRKAEGRSRMSGVPARVERLVSLVFGERPADLNQLRYQLLHGLAGTRLEAEARGADVAVFLVHEFRDSSTDDRKVECNRADIQRFARTLGVERSPDAGASGSPVPVRASGPLAGEPALFMGIARSRVLV